MASCASVGQPGLRLCRSSTTASDCRVFFAKSELVCAVDCPYAPLAAVSHAPATAASIRFAVFIGFAPVDGPAADSAGRPTLPATRAGHNAATQYNHRHRTHQERPMDTQDKRFLAAALGEGDSFAFRPWRTPPARNARPARTGMALCAPCRHPQRHRPFRHAQLRALHAHGTDRILWRRPHRHRAFRWP